MVLTYDSYNETLEKEQERESEIKRLQEKYELDMKSMREEMENRFQQILTMVRRRKISVVSWHIRHMLLAGMHFSALDRLLHIFLQLFHNSIFLRETLRSKDLR